MAPLRDRPRTVNSPNLDAIQLKPEDVGLLIGHCGDVELLAERFVGNAGMIHSGELRLCLLRCEGKDVLWTVGK